MLDVCPEIVADVVAEADVVSSDDSESEEDGKVMKNMVAFGARKEKSSESSDSDVSTDSEDYHVMLNKWLNLNNENLRLQHDLVQGREQYEDLAEELADGVRQEVLQRVAVSNKPKVVHQCNTMKVRQEVGHKKVECFAREKSRNMAKKVNKTFMKLKKVEEVFLAKGGLLDGIKDGTSEEGCSSVRSDLEEDQEASSVESGHKVVCDTKGKEIEVRQEVMRDDLQEGDSEITPR
ncbi:hypothetical protein F2Q70_00031332 [Brassica cretica]|uniref:Uncharacterized protein n=1 Tax=Brassica cretica TaxID=69181 RepID=A0A8S9FNQ7_BRACR|nr:hypothetical protein F2Q70_00031332 [Brassica cretica]